MLIDGTHIVNKMPSLEDFKVFLTAANLGSFSAAAAKLDASPAYVSKRIGLLEQSLGIRLFLRSPRKVSLTLEGKIVLQGAEQLLETMDLMVQEIGTEKQVPRGRLRIATSTGFGSKCIAPMISELIIQYPELEVDLELLDRPVDLLSEGFDIELRVGGGSPQHLIERQLAANNRVLCAAPEYLDNYGIPESLSALANHRCIGIRERDQSYGHWRMQRDGKMESVELSAGLATNNGEVAKEWCLRGHGILLRSIWDVKEDLASGHLVRVLPQYSQPADIRAIYPSRLETSAKLRAAVTYFEAKLPRFFN